MLAIIAIVIAWLSLMVSAAFFLGMVRHHERLTELEHRVDDLGRSVFTQLHYQADLIRALPTQEAVKELVKNFSN